MHPIILRPKLLFKLASAIILPLTTAGLAQVTMAQDTIVPVTGAATTNTVVTHNDNLYDIQGGTLSGGAHPNLFHRFQEFNLGARETANFVTPSQVQNVINLIDSRDPSVINGLLQLSGSQANLYLVNPSGVIFGENAQLNIPASLSVSTADGLLFNRELLTVEGLPLVGTELENLTNSSFKGLTGNPDGYVFAALQPAGIVNRGHLVVATGADISLIGGTVRHEGSLTAASGTVTLAAVPGGYLVRLTRPGNLLSLEIEPIIPNQALPHPTPFDSGGVIPLPARLTGGVADEATTMITTSEGTVLLSNGTINPGKAGLNPEETGTTLVRGDINVSGNVGGEANLFGSRIALLNSDLLANGLTRGGVVQIGGSSDSGVTSTHNDLDAVYVLVNRGSRLSARASNGTGGNIWVWADQQVQFYGQVDVSGSGSNGEAGTILINSAGTVELLSPASSRLSR